MVIKQSFVLIFYIDQYVYRFYLVASHKSHKKSRKNRHRRSKRIVIHYLSQKKNIRGTSLMMMTIAPNSRARKGGKERGEVKREYGGISDEEGECRLRGNSATQSATCCTMSKRG